MGAKYFLNWSVSVWIDQSLSELISICLNWSVHAWIGQSFSEPFWIHLSCHIDFQSWATSSSFSLKSHRVDDAKAKLWRLARFQAGGWAVVPAAVSRAEEQQPQREDDQQDHPLRHQVTTNFPNQINKLYCPLPPPAPLPIVQSCGAVALNFPL